MVNLLDISFSGIVENESEINFDNIVNEFSISEPNLILGNLYAFLRSNNKIVFDDYGFPLKDAYFNILITKIIKLIELRFDNFKLYINDTISRFFNYNYQDEINLKKIKYQFCFLNFNKIYQSEVVSIVKNKIDMKLVEFVKG